MKKHLFTLFASLLLSLSAFSALPASGFFAGLGGSYNAVNLKEDLNAYSGVTNVYNSLGQLVASGTAGGPAPTYRKTENSFSPLVQLGYFHAFLNSHFLWGTKFVYQYLNTNITHAPVDIPQSGSFSASNLSLSNTTLIGQVVVGSTETRVKHELFLLPFIAYSVRSSYVYLGAGPALFDTNSKLNDGIGYANEDDTSVDLTGAPVNFSNSRWVWGAAAQTGITYFVSSKIFIDANYTFTVTQHYLIKDSGAFSSTFIGGDGNTYSDNGTFFIRNNQREIIQSVGLSINRMF